MLVIALTTLGATARAQSWVQTSNGPMPGDSGPRTDAIVLRQIIGIHQSPARSAAGQRLPYNHPAMLCQTRASTMLMIWNGGPEEASSLQRVWAIRKPQGSATWSDPYLVEPEVQVDAGTVYQPRRPGSPIICGYWLNPPHQSPNVMRLSRDDGKTWSPRQPTPTVNPEDYAYYDKQPSARRTHALGMNPPLEFPDGTLWFADAVCPGKFERIPVITVVPPDNYAGDPKGTPWKSIHRDLFAEVKGTHPTLMTLDFQTILLIPRYQFSGNKGTDFITRDAGKTWAARAMVPASGPGLCGVGLDIHGGPARGWFVMTWSGPGGAGVQRNGLCVYASKDPTQRESWKRVLLLHENIPAEDADPSIIQTDDRKLHLLFTGRGSSELKYYVLDPDKLIANAPAAPLPAHWPSLPTTMNAQTGPGGVVVSWDDAKPIAAGYHIWRRKIKSGDGLQKIASVGAEARRYTDGQKLAAGRYTYWVQAFTRDLPGMFAGPVTVQAGSGAATKSEEQP